MIWESQTTLYRVSPGPTIAGTLRIKSRFTNQIGTPLHKVLAPSPWSYFSESHSIIFYRLIIRDISKYPMFRKNSQWIAEEKKTPGESTAAETPKQ